MEMPFGGNPTSKKLRQERKARSADSLVRENRFTFASVPVICL